MLATVTKTDCRFGCICLLFSAVETCTVSHILSIKAGSQQMRAQFFCLVSAGRLSNHKICLFYQHSLCCFTEKGWRSP